MYVRLRRADGIISEQVDCAVVMQHRVSCLAFDVVVGGATATQN